jgi:hypothetical protein
VSGKFKEAGSGSSSGKQRGFSEVEVETNNAVRRLCVYGEAFETLDNHKVPVGENREYIYSFIYSKLNVSPRRIDRTKVWATSFNRDVATSW